MGMNRACDGYTLFLELNAIAMRTRYGIAARLEDAKAFCVNLNFQIEKITSAIPEVPTI